MRNFDNKDLYNPNNPSLEILKEVRFTCFCEFDIYVKVHPDSTEYEIIDYAKQKLLNNNVMVINNTNTEIREIEIL